MLYQAGLVLEGGGMKGVYTARVLDAFLDKGIDFAKCYGVSAGACHLCSYLSKQKGRAYAVVTNSETGLAEYLPMKDLHTDIEAVRASASLPLVSRNVKIKNSLYFDGGLADPIPLLHSITDGNRKNVVVLTKETGYRRKPSGQLGLLKVKYAKYPRIYELMKNRHIEYNRTLDYLEEQVKNKTAFVIRPSVRSEVGRIEKDVKKLYALYQEGYEEAAQRFEELTAYLESGT